MSALTSATSPFYRKSFRSFCQINSFPILDRVMTNNLKPTRCFAVAQLFFQHCFYYDLFEFCCIPFLCYSFWHNKAPHLLFSIPYCLTNGVQFTLHSPRCRSVKKMCRWHIFSVGRSGYAARKEPCLSFPLPANISLLRRGAHCAPRLGMALRFLLLEGPPRAAVPTVFQVQSTEVFLFYPQKVMKKGPGRQSGAKCKRSLPSRSAQPAERAFMKAFFAYFLSRKKVG